MGAQAIGPLTIWFNFLPIGRARLAAAAQGSMMTRPRPLLAFDSRKRLLCGGGGAMDRGALWLSISRHTNTHTLQARVKWGRRLLFAGKLSFLSISAWLFSFYALSRSLIALYVLASRWGWLPRLANVCLRAREREIFCRGSDFEA